MIVLWMMIGVCFGLAIAEKVQEWRRKKADPTYYMVNE